MRLIKVSFKVNKEINFGTSVTVRLIEGVHLIRCLLNTGFTVLSYTGYGFGLNVLNRVGKSVIFCLKQDQGMRGQSTPSHPRIY